MTVSLAIPPDRLRGALGFVLNFIGLALDAMTALPGRPRHRVAFLLDELGQLGRLDSLLDGLALTQLWRPALVFCPGPIPIEGRLPALAGFLATTTQRYFGTAD